MNIKQLKDAIKMKEEADEITAQMKAITTNTLTIGAGDMELVLSDSIQTDLRERILRQLDNARTARIEALQELGIDLD